MSSIVLNALCVLAHLIFITHLSGGYYYPHLTDEETGTERLSKLRKVIYRL